MIKTRTCLPVVIAMVLIALGCRDADSGAIGGAGGSAGASGTAGTGATAGSGGGAGVGGAGGAPHSNEFQVDANTVGLWHLNEGSGQFASDSSGHGHDLRLGQTSGTDSDDPTWTVMGRFGNGLEFNAAEGDFAFDGTGSTFPTNEASLELWYRTTTKDGRVFRAGNLTCEMAWANGGTIFYFVVGDGTNWTRCAISDPAVLDKIADGQWHYLAGTYDGGTERLYVDGIEEANVAVVLPVAEPAFHSLGGDISLNFVDGLIDEVRLSDIARTPQEIQDHFAGATSP